MPARRPSAWKRSRPTALLRCIAYALTLALAACDAGSHDDHGVDAHSAALSPADRARLEALGYEPWVEERRPPRNTGVVRHDEDRSEEGFILYPSRGACSAVLMDRSGVVLHRWQGPVEGFWSDTELLPDGTLLVVGATDDRREQQQEARYLRRLAWDSSVLWEARFPAHHDVEVLPDGRILTISSTIRTVLDGATPRVIVDDEIVLANDDGDVLEVHSIADAYRAAPDGVEAPFLALRPVRIGEADAADVFHTNSVEWIDRPDLAEEHPIYAGGNVLISMRHQHRIAVFDREKRRIIWSWGKGELDGQHSARLLSSGNILVFDNGLGSKKSRIIELDPRTEKIVWEFSGPEPTHFFSPGGGASQRLPNGNTLVTDTRKGRLFEVTHAGDLVWKLINPTNDPGSLRRATIHASKWLPASYVVPILERRTSAMR